MRAINGLYYFCNDNNLDCRVFWQITTDCFCPYSKLFKPNSDFKVKDYIQTNAFQQHVLYPTLPYTNNFSPKNFSFMNIFRFLINLNRRLIYHHVISSQEILEISKSKNYSKLLCKSNAYISTCYSISNEKISHENWEPIDELKNIINRKLKSFNNNTIGLHIRRNDNLLSIKHSPLENFIEKMNLEIGKNKNTRFFLATDSVEIENLIKRKFNDKLIIYKKILSRNSEKGIQDALVDMYLLANTKKIYGSYHSSFSNVAAELFSKEIEIIYNP